jgi:TPR repeat protein
MKINSAVLLSSIIFSGCVAPEDGTGNRDVTTSASYTLPVEEFREGVAAYEATNYSHAFKKIMPFAEKGNRIAQHLVGKMYGKGQGTPTDKTQAAYWYKKAAIQGFEGSQHNLALLYMGGEGVSKDPEQAAYWMRLAADQGNLESLYGLAEMYFGGLGLEKDVGEAINLYMKAAEQNHDLSNVKLGRIYDEGIFVTKDERKAFQYYRQAAVLNFPFAQFLVGMRYARGWGVEKNDIKAYMWTQIAVDNNFSRGSGVLAALKKRMVFTDVNIAKGGVAICKNSIRSVENKLTTYASC